MFQARVTQLLKKLNWPTRKDNLSIVSNNARPLNPSPNVLRKPDMSNPLQVTGFRLEDTFIPTDTDDSSSSSSPTRQSRRYSAWDGHTQSSVNPVFAAHGPAPLFIRKTTALEGTAVNPSGDAKTVLAPAPLFLLAGASTDHLTRATNDASSNIVDTSPAPDVSPPLERLQTPRPMEGPVHSNEPVTNIDMPHLLVEPESSQAPVAPALPTSLPPSPLPASTIQERRLPGTQLTTTLPPPFCVATERGLRLSPSIIARQPMPILRLPILPVPTPTQETPVPPTVRLRHVPSLSVHGRPGVQPEPESPADDEDEDDDNDGYEDEGLRNDDLDHQSDEDGDGEDMKSLGTGYSQTYSPLREFQSHVIDLTPPPIAGPSSRPSVPPYSAAGATSWNVSDDIDTTPSRDASTPKPFSPKAPLAESIQVRRRVTPMTSSELNHAQPSMRVSREPGLYRQPSRSMVDLSMSRRDLRLKRIKSGDTLRSNKPSLSGNTVETVESDDTDRIVGKLMRRTSMPTFTSTSDPPPYPSFDPRPQKNAFPIQCREDEGRERLPPYSNSLYLTAIMPRKMEFTSPGVQAKDRKWRRVFCELEGTVLRVYKCPPGASGAGVIGEWWERRVGVGDLTSVHHAARRKPDESPAPSSKIGVEQPVVSPPGSPLLTENRERSESISSTNRSLTPSTSRANRRLSGASFLAPWRNSGSSSHSRGRGASSTSQPGTNGGMELLPVSEPTSRRNSVSSSLHEDTPQSTPRTQRATSRPGFFSSRMQLRSGEIQKPAEGDLIRAYTLQYAESGLGNDYLKRKNVIRVRLEGEQFLLQAADVPSVVEWIEVRLILRRGGYKV